MFDSRSDFSSSADDQSGEEGELMIEMESSPILDPEESESSLARENVILKAQFSEALRVSSQMETVYTKNRKLTAAINEFRSANEGLNGQVAILQRSNQELTEKLKVQSEESERQRERESENYRKSLTETKRLAHNEVDSVCESLKELQNEKDKAETEVKVINNRIRKMLASAGAFFKLEFHTLEAVVGHLEEGVAKVPVSSKKEVPSTPVETTVQRPDPRIKMLTDANMSLESQLKSALRDKSEIENRLACRISALESKQTADEYDQALLDDDRTNEIAALKDKVAVLKVELEKERKENMERAVRVEPIPEKARDVVLKTEHVVAEADIANEELLRCNEDLMEQLQRANMIIEKQSIVIENVKTRNEVIEREFERQTIERDAADMVHNETLLELKSMRNTLHLMESQRDATEAYKLQREVEKQDVHVKTMQKDAESNERQIHDLIVEKDDLTRQLETKATKIRKLQKQVRACNEMIDDLKGPRYADQITCKTEQPSDIIPHESWVYVGFSAELNRVISTYANRNLPAQTKLNGIYKAIVSHYSGIAKAHESVIHGLRRDSQKIRAHVRKFSESMTICLGMEPASFKKFVSGGVGDKVIKRVAELMASLEAVNHKNGELTNVVDHLHNELGLAYDGSVTCAVANVARLKDDMATLRDRTQECRKLNATLSETHRKGHDANIEFRSQIASLTHQIGDMTKRLEISNMKRHNLKENLRTAESVNNSLSISREEQSIVSDEKHQRELKKLRSAIAKTRTGMQQRLNESDARIQSLEAVISDSKKTIHSLNAKIREKSEAIVAARLDADTAERKLVSLANDEKQQLINNYESEVTEQRKQCEAARRDVQRLTDELSRTSLLLKKEKKSVASQLKVIRDNTERDIRVLQDQNDREKRYVGPGIRAYAAHSEPERVTKEEFKERLHDEKRRLYSFVVDSFKRFYNPHDAIDEYAFRSVIAGAKDELDRLTRSDAAVRRIVRAAQDQLTEHAVAQYRKA